MTATAKVANPKLETYQAEAARLQQQSEIRLNAIVVKITQIDFGRMLTPDNLVSAAEIARSKQALQQYYELIEARSAEARSFNAELAGTIRKADLSEADRRAVQAQFDANSKRNLTTFDDLAKAQRKTADAVSALLEFAQSSVGHARVESGQIAFEDQARLDRFQALDDAIQRAVNSETEVEQRIFDSRNKPPQG